MSGGNDHDNDKHMTSLTTSWTLAVWMTRRSAEQAALENADRRFGYG